MREPIGYTYSADNYCPDCIVEMFGATYDAINAEGVLDLVARARGIDRYDERSYDSGDFPKVIFHAHDVCNAYEGYEPGQCGDRCGRCHEFLGGDCPNVA